MNADHLKAVAGWALMKRHDDPAYGNLADSAGAVAELEARKMVVEPSRAESARATTHKSGDAVGTTPLVLPDVVIRVDGGRVATVPTCREGGEHRFALTDQRCLYCGATYKDIRARKPELM